MQKTKYPESQFLTLSGELCCEKQFSIYKQFGQKNGMTPYEYLDVVMNFTDHNRKLNYIKVQVNL